MRVRTVKKNSPSQMKYISVSNHKLPFPVPARHWPTIFPRHLSWFISEEKAESWTSRKREEKSGWRRGRRKLALSYEELIDLVRRYAGILRSDQLCVQAWKFLFRESSDHWSLEFEYTSLRSNIVSAFKDLLKLDRRATTTLKYWLSSFYLWFVFLIV